MRTIQKNFKAVVLCTGFVVVICLAFVLAKPGYAGVNNGNAANIDLGRILQAQWLSQYEGKRIRVTFAEAPTHIANDLKKTTYIDLINAGPTGIVVGIKPQRTIFFPYTQIMSIEPVYNTR
ncbi:MAG: hypothetical protein JXA96_17045 [Sedimentisphaerales bacterium]|nr:hypothetical protein [Sedimentisphaerales bacterium]